MINKLWPLAVEAIQALGAQYGPAMEETAVAAGLERPIWFLLLPALLFEPDAVSAKQLRLRMPYNAPKYYNEGLATLASQGMLVAGSKDKFRLSEKGRKTVQSIVESAYARMADLEPIPLADLEGLAGLLSRLVETSLAAPEPPGKWSLRLSRRTDPGKDTAVVIRVDQYLSDLNAYRDDAHLATWQPYGISGSAWEAFTLLWRGEVKTLDGLCQKLAWRRYTRDDYAAALQDLNVRGWIATNGDQLQVTATGQAVRQESEETTDRYFYTPWACLNEAELEALESLLRQFRNTLT